MIPRATYRLQFTAGFRFADAAALAPYLARLGISHVYASPVFAARPGSTHGYDVTDPTRLNPELGGEDDFRAMAAAFRADGLGLILDIVPNHMGVGGASNRFWLSVLEWGPRAPSPAGSTSTGPRPGPASPARCSCRSSAPTTARCWKPAASSSASTRPRAASRSGRTTPTSSPSARATTPRSSMPPASPISPPRRTADALKARLAATPAATLAPAARRLQRRPTPASTP